ncbi:uncharacterized protein EI90DRAFT_3011718 [Cantharellus anzutake]|uniref:uncharacterized protein n=1 Tax=Cantharellus anzutake TaxID=1750568 RepID=UPI001903CD34|nr:uncharacterized protein EI90DRAFT_3011718 [Cantharellus anzutake]KAF8342198.1 hypothetical protein EI90DRAFT_3011718 [Cantharellus anzutake]
MGKRKRSTSPPSRLKTKESSSTKKRKPGNDNNDRLSLLRKKARLDVKRETASNDTSASEREHGHEKERRTSSRKKSKRDLESGLSGSSDGSSPPEQNSSHRRGRDRNRAVSTPPRKKKKNVEDEAESYRDDTPLSDRISPSNQKRDHDQEPSSLRGKEHNPKHRRDKHSALSPSPKGSRKEVESELSGSGEDFSSGAGIEDKESRSPLEDPGISAVVKISTPSPAPKYDFSYVRARVRLSLAPVFLRNPTSGVFELLDAMTMKYVPDFRGVLLAHSNAKILDSKAKIMESCPFASVDVGFNALIWSPSIGMKLTGEVNLCSPSHISLLIHRIFNVSIPRRHIPTNEWHFETENDPEYEAREDEMQVDGGKAEGWNSIGWWVNTSTGKRIGGKKRLVTFTVIGMIEAHRMLSLKGSLQPDPFNPAHSLQLTNSIESQPSTTSASEPTARRETEEGSEDGDNDDINEKEEGRPRRKVRFSLHMGPIPSDSDDE